MLSARPRFPWDLQYFFGTLATSTHKYTPNTITCVAALTTTRPQVALAGGLQGPLISTAMWALCPGGCTAGGHKRRKHGESAGGSKRYCTFAVLVSHGFAKISATTRALWPGDCQTAWPQVPQNTRNLRAVPNGTAYLRPRFPVVLLRLSR